MSPSENRKSHVFRDRRAAKVAPFGGGNQLALARPYGSNSARARARLEGSPSIAGHPGGRRGRSRKQVRYRAAGAPGRGPALHHRARTLCGRYRAGAADPRGAADVAARPRPHQEHQYREGAQGGGRAGGHHCQGSCRGQARHPDPDHARRLRRTQRLPGVAPAARERRGAPRRRPGRVRGGGDRGAGAQRRRADRNRLRAAAGRHHHRTKRPRTGRPRCGTTTPATSPSS